MASCRVRSFSKVLQRIPLGFQTLWFKIPGFHPILLLILSWSTSNPVGNIFPLALMAL